MQKLEVLRAIKACLKRDYEVLLMNQNQLKKSEKNFDDARIETIKKDFNKMRDRFSK